MAKVTKINVEEFDYFIGSDASIVSFDNTNTEFDFETVQESLNHIFNGVGSVDVRYENHPEFIAVKTDNNGRIVWGIKADGTIYFGAGVPPQVVEYINELVAEIRPAGYESILDFLNNLETGEVNLSELLNNKVDKEENKSLIDASFADAQSCAENPEFLQVYTDSEDKVIQGIRTDGTMYVGCDEEIIGNLTVRGTINNPSINQQIIDAIGDVGQQIESHFENIDNFINNPNNIVPHGYLDEIDNQEWLSVTTDNNGYIINGIKRNGEIFYGQIPEQINDYVNDIIDERKDGLKTEIKDEIIQEIDYNPSTAESKSVYYKNYGFSPLIRGLEPHPLVYSIPKFINKPLILQDGRIIYADGESIKIINYDKSVDTLLTLTHANGYRLVWMDSNTNVYVAPNVQSEADGSIGGIWRLAHGESQFQHVLDLYDVIPEVPSSKEIAGEEHEFTFWTMTEDRQGRMYAGVYGQPYCPYLYVSTNGGTTWSFLKDMSEYAPTGKHIHFIEYNKYDNALYCTVGEVNKLFKSTDGGNNWIDMNVELEYMKSTSILCVEDGIILGSDYGYWGMLYKVYPDGSYRTTAKTMANQFFSIRESDVTGWLYAFGRKPSIGNSWFPTAEAATNPTVLQNWIDSSAGYLDTWYEYRESMETLFPDDCIVPQHTIVMISKDRGESWQVLFMIDGNLSGMGGHFRNGEIGVSLISNRTTYIISEGKHKYTADGINIEGEIFSKAINSSFVVPII